MFNALGVMWFCDIKPFQFSWVPSLLILSIVIIRERLGRRISFQYSFLYISLPLNHTSYSTCAHPCTRFYQQDNANHTGHTDIFITMNCLKPMLLNNASWCNSHRTHFTNGGSLSGVIETITSAGRPSQASERQPCAREKWEEQEKGRESELDPEPEPESELEPPVTRASPAPGHPRRPRK